MRKNLYNQTHGGSMTSEMAIIDNIARELEELNETMKKMLEAIQLIAIKSAK
jgi:hypothetical protein